MRIKSCFLFIFIFNVVCISSKDVYSIWPMDDSESFPYTTPSPINIKSREARPIITSTPLKLNSNLLLLAKTTNTGSSLLLTALKGFPQSTTTGGILYNDTYVFFQREYFWDLTLKRAVGDTLNGLGAPLQAVGSFYNLKYGNLQNAMSKRDGIFQLVIFVEVGLKPNPSFYLSEVKSPLVRNAGSSTTTLEFFNSVLPLVPSLRKDYYAYPGQYVDQETGKTYCSSTVAVWPVFPSPYISFDQFNATFGSLLNKFGKPYSNIGRRSLKSPRTLVHAYKIEA